MAEQEHEPIGYPLEIAGFILQVVRMTKRVYVKSKNEMQDVEGYAIQARPKVNCGYFHAMYDSQSDAEIVLGRMVDRFDSMAYNVNFTNDMNPAVLTSLEHEGQRRSE